MKVITMAIVSKSVLAVIIVTTENALLVAIHASLALRMDVVQAVTMTCS